MAGAWVNHQATQLHMPMTDSAASRWSRGTELSAGHAFFDDCLHLGEDLRARLQVQGGCFVGERGLGQVQNPGTLWRSGALQH